MWETPVFAEEEQLISNSVEKRQREFRAGRHCAHLALEIAGCHNVPAIMAGSYRQPLWPIGFIGSISHCQDLCLAAVAVIGNGGIFSLGIDVELANPIPIEIYNHVFVLNELEALKKYPPLAETIIFSAKESIYKCFFPLIEEFFDFSIVSIKLDFEQGSFYIFSTFPPIVKILEEKKFEGKFSQSDSHIITSAILIG